LTGAREGYVPLSTVCKSSTLKELKSCDIFGWKYVGKTVYIPQGNLQQSCKSL
jgi:hypothetical protein